MLAFGLAIFSAAPAVGQLTLTIQANTLSPSYDEGYPDEGESPSLTVITSSTAPASMNYAGLTSGTFTLQFLAPTGYNFVIDPVEGPLSFDFQVAYTTFNSGGASAGLNAMGPGAFSFLGLEGTAPTLTTSHTMGDIPHAYLAVSAWGEVTESFSFTGFQYSFDYTGTGVDLAIPHFEGGNLRVKDSDYAGFTPPDHSAIFTVSAIPEPSTYAALAGVAALGLAVWRRRPRRT